MLTDDFIKEVYDEIKKKGQKSESKDAAKTEVTSKPMQDGLISVDQVYQPFSVVLKPPVKEDQTSLDVVVDAV